MVYSEGGGGGGGCVAAGVTGGQPGHDDRACCFHTFGFVQ